jgi:hypothetical protein
VDIFSTICLNQEKDCDSEESDLHELNIICDTDKDNDDFCVDFMDEEDKFSFSRRENVNNKTIRNTVWLLSSKGYQFSISRLSNAN